MFSGCHCSYKANTETVHYHPQTFADGSEEGNFVCFFVVVVCWVFFLGGLVFFVEFFF